MQTIPPMMHMIDTTNDIAKLVQWLCSLFFIWQQIQWIQYMIYYILIIPFIVVDFDNDNGNDKENYNIKGNDGIGIEM